MEGGGTDNAIVILENKFREGFPVFVGKGCVLLPAVLDDFSPGRGRHGFVDRDGFEVYPEPASRDVYRQMHPSAADKDVPDDYGKAPAMKMERVDDGLLNHVGNLLECMRTRQHPRSDIEYGHRSSSACILGNVAIRTREHLAWDVANQTLLKGSPAAQNLLTRQYRAPWKLTVQNEG